MKKYIFTAAFGALVMLTGCASLADMIIPENEIDPPVQPVANKMPSVNCVRDEVHELKWYKDFCKNIKSGKDYVVVEGKVKSNDVKKALCQIKNDEPTISWLGSTYYSETVTDGTKIHTSLLEDVDEDEIADMKKKLEKAIEDILKEVPEGADDYEKILFIHDYIVDNTEYDYEGAESGGADVCHTAYGCLVNGKAVCSGYAEAFQCFMQELDIESGICTGSNHAWNYVKLDGEYYWIDTTWDDAGKKEPKHTFFLFNTEQLLNTRTFDSMQSFVPECTDDNNYFVRNGGFFESYDEDSVIEYIESRSNDGHCEMMFGSFEAYEQALDGLIRKSHLYKADGVGSDNLKYYRNDDMYALEIIF